MNNEQVLYQIKSLDKLIMRTIIGEDIKCLNMPTLTQIQIMSYILKNDKKIIYQKDLEEILNLRRATVSGVLGTMEKHGLLMRSISEEDARKKAVILTEKARNIFKKKSQTLNELENKIIQNISVDELNIFINVLNKMKNNIS